MKHKLPISFYFKLLFIIIVLGGTYLVNHSLINATMADPSLSTVESVNVILQGILGIPKQGEQELISNHSTEGVSFPGNTQPQLIPEEIKEHPNYQLALERADQFNQTFDATEVNAYLVDQVNQYRLDYSSTIATSASYLSTGAQARAFELAKYHYLSSNTVDGTAFYSFFPDIIEPQYRLGENLYELYIAADDIHLETWQNSKILASYLYGVFQDSLETELYQNYRGLYAWVHAEPSDYQIDDASYIRLVVVLTLDTQTD